MTYYYICPYCEEDKNTRGKGRLELTKDLDMNCFEHKKGFFDKDKECRKEDFVCKEVYKCNTCNSTFRGDKEFLKAQRRRSRKDKDG